MVRNVAHGVARRALHGEIGWSQYVQARLLRLAAAVTSCRYRSDVRFQRSLEAIALPSTKVRLASHPLWAQACLGPLQGRLSPVQLRKELTDWVCGQGRPRHTLNAFVADGDWSALLVGVDSLPVFVEAQQLLDSGMDYRRMPIYEQMIKAMREGRPARRQQRRLDSALAIDQYFERYVRLFLSIQRHGMLAPAYPVLSHPWRMGTGIGVAMGPDGQWVKLPGAKHRVAIAQALGLPHIPVQLGMVHGEAIRRMMRDQQTSVVPALRELVARFRCGMHPFRDAACPLPAKSD